MALPSSGNSISFSQIQTEFGTVTGKNLGAYRISENYGGLSNLPLDTGIPQSGQIKFSDFQGKKLNIIVDYYSSSTPTYGETAKNTYNNNDIRIVGGKSGITTTKPDSTSGKKIIVYVNRTIGSTKGNKNYCALKTGSWDSNTEVVLNIGSTGAIYGAGGDGGTGRATSAGDNGGQGTSALGIQYPTTLINNGNIIAGTGGGGGGGGAYGYKHSDTQQQCEGLQANAFSMSGGGGGGGRGYPVGSGGDKSTSATGSAQYGQNGYSGSGGNGGNGASIGQNWQTCWSGAAGGRGGDSGQDGSPGTNYGSSNTYGGGTKGDTGYAIIISSSGSLSNVSGNISGDTLNPGTPA